MCFSPQGEPGEPGKAGQDGKPVGQSENYVLATQREKNVTGSLFFFNFKLKFVNKKGDFKNNVKDQISFKTVQILSMKFIADDVNTPATSTKQHQVSLRVSLCSQCTA